MPTKKRTKRKSPPNKNYTYQHQIKPFLDDITQWASEGKIDQEISAMLGVSYAFFQRNKKLYPAFLKALNAGKEIADEKVERSLFQRATGMTITEEVEEEWSNSDGTGTKTKTVRREIPPDTTAIIFWLKNRKRHFWRDRHDVEHGVSLEMVLEALPNEIRQTVERELSQIVREGDRPKNVIELNPIEEP